MREHPPGPCTLFLGRSETTGRHGGYSSDGRAPGCGPGCRGFKSRYSPLMIKARPAKTGRAFFMPEALGTRREHGAPGNGSTRAAVTASRLRPGLGPVDRLISARALRHIPHTPPAGAGRAGASSRSPRPRLPARRPAGPYAFPHEPPSTGHAPHRSCRALPRRGRTSPAPPEQPCSRPSAARPGVRRPGPGAWSDQSPVPAAGGAGRRCQAAPGKLPGFSGPPPARPPADVFRGSPGERSRGCGSGPPPRRRCG